MHLQVIKGVIFQVPEGTTDFVVTGNTYMEVEYDAFSKDYEWVQMQPTFYLSAPHFSTNLSTLDLIEKKLWLRLPHIGYSKLFTAAAMGLVSKPDWLDVSPTKEPGPRTWKYG